MEQQIRKLPLLFMTFRSSKDESRQYKIKFQLNRRLFKPLALIEEIR